MDAIEEIDEIDEIYKDKKEEDKPDEGRKDKTYEIVKKTPLEMLKEWAQHSQTLELPVVRVSSPEEIKHAYRCCSLKHHPDHGGNVEQMACVNDARNFFRKYSGEEIGIVLHQHVLNAVNTHLSDWGITPEQVSLHGDILAQFSHDFGLGESYF